MYSFFLKRCELIAVKIGSTGHWSNPGWHFGLLFSNLPSRHSKSGYARLNSLTLPVIPLPPDVANGTSVLPFRSVTSAFVPFNAGRACGLLISTELRDCLSFQSRSADV